jgi:hypothetical protein
VGAVVGVIAGAVAHFSIAAIMIALFPLVDRRG